MFSIFSLKIDDQTCDVAGEQRHHESKKNISNGYTFNVWLTENMLQCKWRTLNEKPRVPGFVL